MEKVLPYFSFQGRVNRQRYWLTLLWILGLYALGALIGAMLMRVIVGGVLILVVVVAALWAGLALSVRRLHDRGKTGWWLLLMYLPMVLLSGLSQVVAASEPAAAAGFAVLALPFSIWMIVELGCLKGTSGPNRFGDDLLQPAAVEVFS